MMIKYDHPGNCSACEHYHVLGKFNNDPFGFCDVYEVKVLPSWCCWWTNKVLDRPEVRLKDPAELNRLLQVKHNQDRYHAEKGKQ